jgi:hypothetical protein
MNVEATKEQSRVLTEANPIAPEVFEGVAQSPHEVYRSADYLEGVNAIMKGASLCLQDVESGH